MIPPETPQSTEGLRPSVASPREDGAKDAPPPALWLGFRPGGGCWQAVHNPHGLAVAGVEALRLLSGGSSRTGLLCVVARVKTWQVVHELPLCCGWG
jgi:hypothetical protein